MQNNGKEKKIETPKNSFCLITKTKFKLHVERQTSRHTGKIKVGIDSQTDIFLKQLHLA